MDAKLTQKRGADHRTVVRVSEGTLCGGKDLFIVAGPCSVENLNQMTEVADRLLSAPVQALRGGVFKPRTSPYAFQGLGLQGLSILQTVKQTSGLSIVTEVMSCEQINDVSACADVLQVGSRNMQNFELLKALGKVKKPVLLKRGLSATIEEFLFAAEYILSHGNDDVILCERGIRSFDSYTRNVLDLGAVVALKQLTHLPILVDPSHAAGRRELVADLSKGAIACGADGLMIECHPQPDASVSDAQQAISLDSMLSLIDSLRPLAQAVGRNVTDVKSLPGSGNGDGNAKQTPLFAISKEKNQSTMAIRQSCG
jgi:3-deoxy-7-phosphoheptulonate synthase